MRFARFFACLLFFASLMPSLRAHQVSSVELEFLKLDTQWRLLGEMDIAYMLPETRIIPDGLPLSREAVMKSPPGELIRIRKETENTLRKLLRFTFAGKTFLGESSFRILKKNPSPCRKRRETSPSLPRDCSLIPSPAQEISASTGPASRRRSSSFSSKKPTNRWSHRSSAHCPVAA